MFLCSIHPDWISVYSCDWVQNWSVFIEWQCLVLLGSILFDFVVCGLWLWHQIAWILHSTMNQKCKSAMWSMWSWSKRNMKTLQRRARKVYFVKQVCCVKSSCCICICIWVRNVDLVKQVCCVRSSYCVFVYFFKMYLRISVFCIKIVNCGPSLLLCQKQLLCICVFSQIVFEYLCICVFCIIIVNCGPSLLLCEKPLLQHSSPLYQVLLSLNLIQCLYDKVHKLIVSTKLFWNNFWMHIIMW